jgi:hypothetical protein
MYLPDESSAVGTSRLFVASGTRTQYVALCGNGGQARAAASLRPTSPSAETVEPMGLGRVLGSEARCQRLRRHRASSSSTTIPSMRVGSWCLTPP